MRMPPSPLPDVKENEDLFSNHPASAHITSAFRICVDIERVTEDNTKKMYARDLVRDGFRCMVSGKYDSYCVEDNTEFLDQIIAAGLPGGITQCAHILSESANYDVATKDAKHKYTDGVWDVLDCFGYKSVREELMDPKAHRLENILTLSIEAHQEFDFLNIWFEETDTKDQYDIGTTHPRLIFGGLKFSRRVTFKTEHPDVPLPSPTYLKIHAACAKVAHLSGAGEYIDKILRELELTDVLASDGSSAALLKDVLLPYSKELV